MPFEPPPYPFERYGVFAGRLEIGAISEERFYVVEVDLAKDDLGPRALPPAQIRGRGSRARFAALGLSEAEIDARILWARRWMTTRTFRP